MRISTQNNEEPFLLYYVSLTTEHFNYIDFAPFVSLFFSYLIVSMFNLQNTIHHQANNVCLTFCLWIPLLMFTWLPLSSILQILNKLFNAPTHNQKHDIKIKNIVYIELILFIIFSYILSVHILDI
jgi:hypothetical protein